MSEATYRVVDDVVNDEVDDTDFDRDECGVLLLEDVILFPMPEITFQNHHKWGGMRND